MRSFLRMALKDRGENPFRIGWESAKANAVPMVVLWLFAVGLVVGYYFVPGVAEVLKPIAKWQVRWGIRAAIVNQLVFGVLVPAVFVMAERKIRMRRPLLKLACQSGWSVMYAVIFVWFYGLQVAMFGKDNDFTTLTLKAAFDQFVWTPFVWMPISSVFYLWMGNDFSVAKTVERCRSGFVRGVLMPNQVSGWCVWIPVVFVIYAFPHALQFQILGLVNALWTLLLIQIGTRISDER